MPKTVSPKLKIKLDLLHPQSNPEKPLVKLTRWLLSTGRYIFIFVEALVLIAFVARFKLDADLSSLNDAIEEQKPYIESLMPYEVKVKQIQLKLATIANIDQSSPDYSQALKKIAAQTPLSLKINNITFEKNVGKLLIQISGDAKKNTDVTLFVLGLRSDKYFSDVNITGVNFEDDITKFSITANGSTLGTGGNL